MITTAGVYADDSEWEAVEDTFTIENIQHFIPDEAFATAVYNQIKTAIEETTEDNPAYQLDKENVLDPAGYTDKWPEPLTLQEIIDSGETGDDMMILPYSVLMILAIISYVSIVYIRKRHGKKSTK